MCSEVKHPDAILRRASVVAHHVLMVVTLAACEIGSESQGWPNRPNRFGCEPRCWLTERQNGKLRAVVAIMRCEGVSTSVAARDGLTHVSHRAPTAYLR